MQRITEHSNVKDLTQDCLEKSILIGNLNHPGYVSTSKFLLTYQFSYFDGNIDLLLNVFSFPIYLVGFGNWYLL